METKRLTLLSILLALSIVINLVERIVMQTITGSIPFLLPLLGAGGLRIGLANTVVLLVLYTYNTKDAFALLFIRVFIVALATGTLLAVPFYTGLIGGLFAFTMMMTFKKLKVFSLMSVSVMGAIGHVIGQIAVAMFIVDVSVIFYFPFIFLFSIPAGFLVGSITIKLIGYLQPLTQTQQY